MPGDDALLDDRARRLAGALRRHVAGLGEDAAGEADAPLPNGSGLTGREAMVLYRCQLESRAIDLEGRRLRARGAGFYTIGSAGHEGNAAVAWALRASDPAFLHYRSGGFFLARAAQAGLGDATRDVLLGMVGAAEEPIAGGRHKVFGSVSLSIPPQTSTIASHLPKALGTAFAQARGTRHGLIPRFAGQPVPPDAIVVASFGDASASHSTAQGAFQAARWGTASGAPIPLLFVCEDNGWGISVPTPRRLFPAAFGGGDELLPVFEADGRDLVAAFAGARAAVDHVRETRRPAVLHLRVVRLLGHAGSDLEAAYRTPEELAADEAQDPLRRTATTLHGAGVAGRGDLAAMIDEIDLRVRALGDEVADARRLGSAEEVVAPLAPRDDDAILDAARQVVADDARRDFWGPSGPPEAQGPGPLRFHLNAALGDALAGSPDVWIFGEDVGRKGGVYGVTRGLQRRARAGRVFDTLLDEQTILGLAQGAGQLGFLPVPEIQYLAYLHNAEDQIRGEASTLQFFSNGQLSSPMVCRIPSFAYQKGFGGHFHNDCSVAVLRDVPGLVVAVPGHPEDAGPIWRTCLAAARTSGSVCVFLEPIALYPERDLYEAGDGGFTAPYDPSAPPAPLGRGRVYRGDARDVLLVTFGNGLRMSLRAARRLFIEGVGARVLDLRWLSPLPIGDLVDQAREVGRVLVVDETRRSGGVAEGVLAALVDAGFEGPMARVASEDCLIPLGDAARHVLLSEDGIVAAARALARR